MLRGTVCDCTIAHMLGEDLWPLGMLLYLASERGRFGVFGVAAASWRRGGERWKRGKMRSSKEERNERIL